MRLLPAVVAVALVFAAHATAGGTSVKIPAPAIGKVRVEKVTVKASSTPKPRVSNLSALGPGFGGVAVVVRPKKSTGTYVIYFVMFMGNRSSSPASSVDVNLSTGSPGTPTDVSSNCRDLDDIAEMANFKLNAGELGKVGYIIRYKLDSETSTAKSELIGDVGYQRQQAGCK